MAPQKTPREQAEDLMSLLVPDWRPTTQQFSWAITISIVLSLLVAIGYSYGITLWDWLKLLLVPTVIAVGGFWFNRQLQKEKARDELLNSIADSRVLAYKALWEICKEVRFAKDKNITVGDRKKYDMQLDEWYWNDGGAMFLSWTSSRRLMEARNRLRTIKHKTENNETDDKRETKDIKDAFSALRTELKYDCGIVSLKEKPKNIGNLQEWDLDAHEKA